MFCSLNKNQTNISESCNKQGRSNMTPAKSTKIHHTIDTLISWRNYCQVGKHEIHIYFLMSELQVRDKICTTNFYICIFYSL